MIVWTCKLHILVDWINQLIIKFLECSLQLYILRWHRKIKPWLKPNKNEYDCLALSKNNRFSGFGVSRVFFSTNNNCVPPWTEIDTGPIDVTNFMQFICILIRFNLHCILIRARVSPTRDRPKQSPDRRSRSMRRDCDLTHNSIETWCYNKTNKWCTWIQMIFEQTKKKETPTRVWYEYQYLNDYPEKQCFFLSLARTEQSIWSNWPCLNKIYLYIFVLKWNKCLLRLWICFY